MDLVAAERLQGRRVLVYATHTGTRDSTRRMKDFLGRRGFKVAVMKAAAVAPERREAWVANRVEEGVDVLVCHPRLVQTGLDLVDFPTIVWFETDYSVYTMRQASRRFWRIGQTQPVQVVFMAYRNTLQADALKLVAKKLEQAVELLDGQELVAQPAVERLDVRVLPRCPGLDVAAARAAEPAPVAQRVGRELGPIQIECHNGCTPAPSRAGRRSGRARRRWRRR